MKELNINIIQSILKEVSYWNQNSYHLKLKLGIKVYMVNVCKLGLGLSMATPGIILVCQVADQFVAVKVRKKATLSMHSFV